MVAAFIDRYRFDNFSSSLKGYPLIAQVRKMAISQQYVKRLQ